MDDVHTLRAGFCAAAHVVDHNQVGHTQETKPRTILGLVTRRAEVPIRMHTKVQRLDYPPVAILFYRFKSSAGSLAERGVCTPLSWLGFKAFDKQTTEPTLN